MSKVLPINLSNHLDENVQAKEICPRYQKWITRITSSELSNQNIRKRAASKAINSNSSPSHHYLNIFSNHPKEKKREKRPTKLNQCNEPIVTMKIYGKSNAKPPKKKELKRQRRANSIFVQIRQKSRNFGIRCKTSVDLWRKWIKSGIRWDKHSTKSADIDIPNITKPETILKDFSRNNIVDEVILEEDEFEEKEINPNRSSKQDFKQTKFEQSNGHTTVISVNCEDSNLENKSIQQSNGNHSSLEQSFDDDTKVAPNSESKQSNCSTQIDDTTRKYPIQHLASLDIDTIENLNSNEAHKDNTFTNRKPKGSIRRAFNKLKLFF